MMSSVRTVNHAEIPLLLRKLKQQGEDPAISRARDRHQKWLRRVAIAKQQERELLRILRAFRAALEVEHPKGQERALKCVMGGK
jgi:hypothetical protein